MKSNFFNSIGGLDPACIIILPMLGRRMEDYPRFRDCYVTEEGNIAIYTKVGGNNRNCGYGENILYKDENFLKTYDDVADSMYAIYEFKVPDKWKKDFDLIFSENYKEVSDDYVKLIKKFYPKLNLQKFFETIFNSEEEEEI